MSCDNVQNTCGSGSTVEKIVRNSAGSIATSNANIARNGDIFASPLLRRRYWIIMVGLIVTGIVTTAALVLYKTPVSITSVSFIPVMKRRFIAIICMAVVSVCHGLSTISFQTLAQNRIVTPGLLGYEAVYATIHTTCMFFFGIQAMLAFTGVFSFVVQVLIMMACSCALFGWLLSGKHANMQVMLFIGIMIGAGLKSASAWMRRMLTPAEFDILQAKLFGSINNADPDYFTLVIPLIVLAALALIMYAPQLNVLLLGKDTARNLGIHYYRLMIVILVIISLLMSISTATVGSMSSFGFLIATLCYQFCPTYEHKHLFGMSVCIGYVIISVAYFLMYHVFNAQGVVSILIEVIGASIFLVYLMKKGQV